MVCGWRHKFNKLIEIIILRRFPQSLAYITTRQSWSLRHQQVSNLLTLKQNSHDALKLTFHVFVDAKKYSPECYCWQYNICDEKTIYEIDRSLLNHGEPCSEIQYLCTHMMALLPRSRLDTHISVMRSTLDPTLFLPTPDVSMFRRILTDRSAFTGLFFSLQSL